MAGGETEQLHIIAQLVLSFLFAYTSYPRPPPSSLCTPAAYSSLLQSHAPHMLRSGLTWHLLSWSAVLDPEFLELEMFRFLLN